jgi:hypothetical protein
MHVYAEASSGEDRVTAIAGVFMIFFLFLILYPLFLYPFAPLCEGGCRCRVQSLSLGKLDLDSHQPVQTTP